MLRTDIIELANTYTERKGEKLLDMNLLFASTCMDICKRGRHWFRKWDVTFTMSAGVKTYDMTNAALFTPATTNIAVEEIITIALILQTNPLQMAELTPIFDPTGIRSMKQNVTTGQPGRYTISPETNFGTLRIDPPDINYTAEMTFWAMPNLNKDDASNSVPVIPPWHHNIIVEGMEARINRRVYGPSDKRYLNSAASYEASIETMMMRPQFTSNFQRQWVSNDDSTVGGAVQSTMPNASQ